MKKIVWYLIFIIFCFCDVYGLVDSSVGKIPYTYGIRHDKILAEYEQIAQNKGVYSIKTHPDFAPVVAISYSLNGSEERDFIATGTVIDSLWILTAAHNFYVSEEQDAPALVEGIQVLLGVDPNEPTKIFEVEKVVYHPTWFNNDLGFEMANDICLVKLKRPIKGIVPAIMNFEKEETLKSTVWFCGFGDYSQVYPNDPELMSKKHAIENVLDRKVEDVTIQTGNGTYSGGLLAFDFDDPFEQTNSLGDFIINYDEALLGNGSSSNKSRPFEGTTVQGDSGGPLFLKINGLWKVAGVLSGGAYKPFRRHKESSYGDISVFTSVSAQEKWIKTILNQ